MQWGRRYANLPAWLCQGISVLTYFTLESGLATHMILVAHGVAVLARAAQEEISFGA